MKGRILILTATLLIAGAAAAQPDAEAPPAPPCGGQGWGHAWDDGQGHQERMAAHLDLTEEQKEAVGKLLEEGRQRRLETRKAMMRLRNQLEGELLADEPDAGRVEKLIEEIGDLRTQQEATHMKQRLEIRKLLTKEQRDRMLMHGPRGGHGRGPGACEAPCDRSGRGHRGHRAPHGRRGGGSGRGI
jgi:Spy/CpxP family protein refolding chaperone